MSITRCWSNSRIALARAAAAHPRRRRRIASPAPRPRRPARRRRGPARADRSRRRRPPGGSRGCRWPRPARPWPPPPWRRGGSPRGATPARRGPCRRRGRSTSSRSPSTATPSARARASDRSSTASALSGSRGPISAQWSRGVGAAPRPPRRQHLGDALLGHQPPDHADTTTSSGAASRPGPTRRASASDRGRVEAAQVDAVAEQVEPRPGHPQPDEDVDVLGVLHQLGVRAGGGDPLERVDDRPLRQRVAGQGVEAVHGVDHDGTPAARPAGRPYQPGFGLWVCTMSGRRSRSSLKLAAPRPGRAPGPSTAWRGPAGRGGCRPLRAGDVRPRRRHADDLVAGSPNASSCGPSSQASDMSVVVRWTRRGRGRPATRAGVTPNASPRPVSARGPWPTASTRSDPAPGSTLHTGPMGLPPTLPVPRSPCAARGPTICATVLELAQASLRWRPEDPNEAFFRWKHLDNPAGASPMWVATADERLVGFRIFLRWRFRDRTAACATRCGRSTPPPTPTSRAAASSRASPSAPSTSCATRALGVTRLIASCLNDACRHTALIDVFSYPAETKSRLPRHVVCASAARAATRSTFARTGKSNRRSRA